MSDQDDWVRAQTPRDDSEAWANTDEYGTAVEPEQWDDYSSEQSAPVIPSARREEVVQSRLDEVDANAGVFAGGDEEPTSTPTTGQRAWDQPVVESDAWDQPVVESDALVNGSQRRHEPGTSEPTVTNEPTVSLDEDAAAPVLADFPDEDEQDVRYRSVLVPRPERIQAHRELNVPKRESFEPAAEQVDEPHLEYTNHSYTQEFPPLVPEPQRPAVGEDQAGFAAQETSQIQPAVAEDATTQRPRPVAADEEHAMNEPVDGEEPTRVAPLGAVDSATPSHEGLYRTEARVEYAPEPEPAAEATSVIDRDAQEAEERRLEEQLRQEQEARQQRLGVVQTAAGNEVREPVAVPQERVTDKFLGSLGLFLLRVVTAAVLGVTSYQILTDLGGAANILSTTQLPQPTWVARIAGVGFIALAVLLLLGLLTRLSGLLVLAAAVVWLVFLRWGTFNPFRSGFEGFMGDRELLLAGIGFLLFSLGAGGWSLDRAFRRGREDRRDEEL